MNAGDIRDFDPDLLMRLGHLVVRWGYLEELIANLFVWTVDADPSPMTVVTANSGADKLAQWARTVLDAAMDTSANAVEARDLLSQFDRVRIRRNPYVHGIWALTDTPGVYRVQTARLEWRGIIKEITVTTADVDSLIGEVLDLAIKLHHFLTRIGVRV